MGVCQGGARFINPWGLILSVTVLASSCSFILAECPFDAIFNFGDSNSDTGGFYAAFPAQEPPFGVTHFGRPTGRASDGRLVVDFLAEALGFPYLSPYLRSIGSNYLHGANFATLASTVLYPNTSLFVTGLSPFSLGVQLNQMKNFKATVLASGQSEGFLPSSDVFSKALYLFDIGQNDFTSNLGALGAEGVKQYLPSVISQIAETINQLYAEGGRTFLVFNLAPVGCYPAFLTQLPHSDSDLDEHGCMTSYNNAVSFYNSLLAERLRETRSTLHDASVIYVDTQSIKLELFRNPTAHGFQYGTKACCGYGGEPYNYRADLFCGSSKLVDGVNIAANACPDPQNYVSWDGIHATEAANRQIAQAIVNGYFTDPSFQLSTMCGLKPIE